jgi:septal ring factor EnvC (AmiA/AmiB activator)
MASSKVEDIKNWILAIGAVSGLAAGAFSVIAKPIQESTKLAALETRMSAVEPEIREHGTNIAVLSSKLNDIKADQDKILNAVLDIKRKL